MKIKILLVMLVLGMASATVQADIIAEYAFTRGSAVSMDADTGTTASNYGFITTTGTYPDGISSQNGDKYTRASNTSNTLAAAITAGKYDYFTITHDSGTVEFETFTYDYTFYLGYQTFTSYVLVDADNDGFEVSDSLGSYSITGATDAYITEAVSINISSLADFTSGSITFRIYYTDASAGTGRMHRVDNVKVSATVPEPATIAILGLGMIAALRTRKH
jgi:hypothetical protein